VTANEDRSKWEGDDSEYDEDEEDSKHHFNFEKLFSLSNQQLLKKKASDLMDIALSVGIATKDLVEKTDYVKAISEYIKVNKDKLSKYSRNFFDL